jgi:hypothetical protein
MKKRTAVAWVLGLLFLGGCCLGGLEPKSKREWESRTYDHPYPVVYEAALNLLRNKGYEFLRWDRQSGSLETDWLEGKMEMTKILAKVYQLGTRSTLVEVSLKVKEKGPWRKEWKDVKPSLLQYDKFFEELDLEIYHQYMRETEKKALEKGK